MGTRRIFRRGGGAQNVKYPPCLASPGIAWAALVKGSSAYSTKAELIPLFSGALLGCPLSVYAGTAGSMAGAPGRWLCRGCRLGGALLLSFSGRSSLSLLSRLSVLSLPSPGRRWLWGLAGWGWWVVIWRAWDSSCCTNTLLQIWLLFKGKAINFERFFLDIAHKVRYNNTRVKEIVNPLHLTASPSAGRRMDGRREPVNQSERRSAK